MIQWAPLQDSSAVKLQKLPSEPRDSTAFGARLDDPKRMFNQIGSPKKDYIGKHVISWTRFVYWSIFRFVVDRNTLYLIFLNAGRVWEEKTGSLPENSLYPGFNANGTAHPWLSGYKGKPVFLIRNTGDLSNKDGGKIGKTRKKNKVTPPVTALLFFHLFSRRFFCVAWPSQRFLCLPICSVAHFGLRFTVFCVC